MPSVGPRGCVKQDGVLDGRLIADLRLSMALESGSTAVEPTKSHRGENFPVASFLLARELRAPVLAFYRFVRQADDVADSPTLSADEKLRRLDAMEAALLAGNPAEPTAA